MYIHVYFIFMEESPTSDTNKKILYTAEELYMYTQESIVRWSGLRLNRVCDKIGG